MPIVFDEVTTEIAPPPEPGDANASPKSTEPATPARTLREDVRQWQYRESRLHAD